MRNAIAPLSESELFYSRLPPFLEFSQFVDWAAYSAVPDDWVVMIADVEKSTQAIEAGRYKAVNMVGAAAIMAVLNICGRVEAPFVFGGDGGVIVVPGTLRAAASDALARLQAVSQTTFGLTLRTGAVPVAHIRALGADVRVRKYQLSAGNSLAMFAGGGTELADRLLKDPAPDNPFRLPPGTQPAAPDLDGLSCRWEPLAARNGKMMSLMVRTAPQSDADAATGPGAVLQDIAAILGHGLQESAPASNRSMKFRWPPRGLWLEARATAQGRHLWRRYLGVLASSLLQFLGETFNARIGDYNTPVYRREVQSNTDFQKYDGTLRLVLDISAGQAADIDRYLAREHAAGRLVYGTHIADTALMTCLVFDLAQSQHMHFVDGAGGGFARAAEAFKRCAAQTDA